MARKDRPKDWLDDEQPWCPPITVYETAAESIDTGLFDASGAKIFKRAGPGRIGFDLSRIGGNK